MTYKTQPTSVQLKTTQDVDDILNPLPRTIMEIGERLGSIPLIVNHIASAHIFYETPEGHKHDIALGEGAFILIPLTEPLAD